jgi:protein SCO1/2
MMRVRGAVLVIAALGLVFTASAVAGDKDGHAHHRKVLEEQQEPNANFSDIVLSDAVLSNQDGVQVGLRDDVVGDKIVVVDFVYTTCTTVCPVLSAVFRQVQNRLDDRLGGEVVMVSISVDPNRDTPQRLKSYAAKFGAKPGWVWLTGQKQIVTRVLEEFGAYTPNFRDHPSMVLVGDGRSGQWSRFLGFPAAEQIVEKIDEFSARRVTQQARAAMRGR